MMSPRKESKKEVIRLRLTTYQMLKLKIYAYSRGQSVSHVLREYIRRLPSPPVQEDPVDNSL